MAQLIQDVNGRIITNKISSEEARELAKKRWEKHGTESASNLLEEAGFNQDNPAPEYLNVLAKMATGNRSGAVSAMGAFLKLTNQTGGGAYDNVVTVLPGERCPTCNRIMATDISVDALQELLAVANERLAAAQA
jgi:hypothetical protein